MIRLKGIFKEQALPLYQKKIAITRLYFDENQNLVGFFTFNEQHHFPAQIALLAIDRRLSTADFYMRIGFRPPVHSRSIISTINYDIPVDRIHLMLQNFVIPTYDMAMRIMLTKRVAGEQLEFSFQARTKWYSLSLEV
ncbi:hypothetical protein [Cohnella candidum]|uniref:Uncharacterized protein n=1 Tax=Cohnella candidum TaxID=2674991 RepID=A0A3G3K3G5_9BACL|nr:hypothetical protein [Cohnella candidum]AYQ74920.1 hypothetical protein EAV92_21615 [Cohnella candidum]